MAQDRPVVSLRFTDFPGPYNPGRIRRLLEPYFELCRGETHPDYVVYSVFGHEYLDYPDAVRIFFTGENIRPDFNLCDYAFGYDWMEFGDRHVRAPNYLLYDHYDQLLRSRRTTNNLDEFRARRFCNFIYTNREAHPFRDEVFEALNAYRKVDSAGAHLRNTEAEIGPAYQGDWWTPKVEFQKNYKFTIAFENSSAPGYTTEKLVHALAAGTIPIYWGNAEVGREFNEKRFINCHQFDSPEAVVACVKEVNESEALQEEILSEPFFPGGQPHPQLTPEAIGEALCRIVSQPLETSRRRSSHFWGRKYEERRTREAAALKLLESRGLWWRLGRRLAGWNHRAIFR